MQMKELNSVHYIVIRTYRRSTRTHIISNNLQLHTC